MTEFEFARMHLGDFTTKGDEIIPRYCPFCHGGQHGDKETFALNVKNHVYKCLRGSCGASGHFSELLRRFGEQPNEVHTPTVKRNYTRPQPPKIDTSGTVIDYIQSRGIAEETARAFGIGGNSRGEVVFPYFENPQQHNANEPVFIKYRPAHKLKQGEAKARREKGTKPILFGMHLCKPGETLYIFEGEFDCMAGYQAHGGNCVSVPSGCKDFTWLETCAEFLKHFDRVAIIGDNDDPGREMMRELALKLECAVFFPDFTLYGNAKDCNEILFRFGSERVRQIMETVKPAPVLGLLNIADVSSTDIDKMPRVLSGFPALDKLTGGLFMGDLNLWTGRRGEGKSTILTQILLEAIEQGEKVCAYSGEIPADRFKYGVCLQAADSLHVCERDDAKTGRKIQFVPRPTLEKINQWLDGKFWLYDNRMMESDESESILRVFEQAYRRYDCRVFLVDNLMIVRTRTRESDFYQAQADFAIKLRRFAERFGVCVHLVVHPRKTSGQAVTDLDEVGGSGTLTNVACAAFLVARLDETNRHELECDSILRCLKNRTTGEHGDIPLFFIPKSKRFVQRGTQEKKFSWNTEPDMKPAQSSELPF